MHHLTCIFFFKIQYRYEDYFIDMQLSIHEKLAHKIYFSASRWAPGCCFLLRLQTIDNVREKIPFLWFVGNISVLKFCGCPAETGAKISFILLRKLDHFLNNLRQKKTRPEMTTQKRERNNWTFNATQMLLNHCAPLCKLNEIYYSTNEPYTSPESAIKLLNHYY